jgi:hypothetical protein
MATPPIAFNFWSSASRRRAAFISIIVTIIGIYLNVSINYAHLISDRARMSADALQSLNVSYGSMVASNGKVCLSFANAELATAPPDLDKKALADGMLKGAPDERPFSDQMTKEDMELLGRCLSGAELAAPADMSILTKAWDSQKLNPKSNVTTWARRNIRKQNFGYLNMHESIFDLVRLEKIDSRMICNQLGTDVDEKHPIIKFISENLVKPLGPEKVKSYYPGLVWYSEHLDFCQHPTRLWFENAVWPLLPSFERK